MYPSLEEAGREWWESLTDLERAEVEARIAHEEAALNAWAADNPPF